MPQNEHRATSRVLDILEMLSSSNSGYTLTEIAKQINAPKSSIFPIIHTLEERHYISLEEHSGKYRIGISAFAVGSTYFNSESILNHIENAMNELVSVCDETCSMGVLNGGNVLYVAKIDSPQSLRLVTHVGKKIPANCTALGKALLSRTSLEEMEDIFIPRGNNYNALNEDIVVTEIVKESEDSKRKEGKIVKIISHEITEVVGLFEKSK